MEWDEIQRGLVVFAHPDDAEFGCAGTVARLTRDAKRVYYVVTTDGSKGSADPGMTPQKLAALRKQEQCEAARILGVAGVEFLDFEDGLLQPSIDLRRAITRALRRYRPDIVMLQSPVRDVTSLGRMQHPDHLATGEATMAAVYPCARDRLTFPELLIEGLEPHVVRELWIMGTGASDHYVDISDVLDVMARALQAHASQVDHPDIIEFVRERARQIGALQGLAYAESFRRIVIP